MNANCYKVIFSKRLGALVAVGEHTSSCGKAASGQGTRTAATGFDFTGVVKLCAAALLIACCPTQLALAQTLASNVLPTQGVVQTGSASINSNGANMAITQSTDKASVNWQSFSIGSAASVNITQPHAQAVLLNRVVGNDPSQILGKLSANGQVILLNPNGIVFGKDGSVTASSFTASTFALSDADFMSGYYKYNRNGSTASVVNNGNIQVASGGYVALMGAEVTNNGTITAPQGAVVMAAAESVALPAEVTAPRSVGVPLSKRVRLELAPAVVNTVVNNTENGVIVTEGGQVLMQAGALATAVASVTHSGNIDTSGPQAGDVTLLADGGRIKVDGRITANSTGQDSQGQANVGGRIVIGRDEDTGVLAASTDMSGATLESNRGFVETSGEYLKTDNIQVKAKDWLLDPNNIEINLSNTPVTAGNSVVLAGDIAAALDAGTNVTISTGTGAGSTSSATGVTQATDGTGNSSTGTIAVNSAITSTYSGSSNPILTLSAASNISIAAAINTSGSDLHLKSTGGSISTTAAINARNISIDNTGGSINASSGAITAGASTSAGTAISLGGHLTASGNLNLFGASSGGTGISLSGSKNLSGATIQVVGKTTNGTYGIVLNGSNTLTTTGTSGDSLIKGMTTGGGTNALLAWGGLTLTSASGTTLTLWGDGRSTGDRAMRLDGGATTNGVVTLQGSSNNATSLMVINGLVTANANSALSITGSTSASNQSAVYFVNGGGVALKNSATLNINGQNTTSSGAGTGVLIQGAGIYRSTGTSGAVTITGSATTGTAGSTGVSVQAGVSTDGNIDIQGNVASAASTGVSITSSGGVQVNGSNKTINISSNYSVANAGYIKVTGTTGTGSSINLTSTNNGISGAGTIGDTTNKNASITITQAGTSTYDGAINAANLTKAGTGTLTLGSWVATTPVATNISNAYTVKDGGTLSLSPGATYAQLNPASVNVENASTFSLNAAGNGFWKNTAFNFIGGLGGGTMNLAGNPVGNIGTTNTFTTSGGATNTVTGLLNANSSNVNLSLTTATSGTALSDGSYAALAFTTNIQGGYGIDNGSTVTIDGGGSVLFKDKLRATTLNINSGTLQMGDGSAVTAATTPDLTVTNVSIGSNAKLIFNRVDNHTNSSAISGAGSFIKIGSGTTTLTGDSTLSGTTTISGGTLQIGNGGATGALGSGAIVNNAALIINRDNTSSATFANAISGTGTLTKTGTGTAILTGDNTYSGATTITTGTLQIGSGSTTGTLGSGSVVDNSTLIFNRSDDITVANAISGTGSIEQAGTGTTTLTSNNTYSGTTTISDGTLQIGNGSTSGSLGSGSVIDNGTLIFNRSDDITVANAISGTGELEQAGTGTTTLTSNNTYSGTTTISDGILQIGNGSTTGSLGSGSVIDNGTLVFNRSNSITVTNAISGTGELSQAGTGTTILTGNNTYSGTTTINDGTLQIGNDTSTGSLGTGAVINNSLLDFKRSANTLVTNGITGTGDLSATLSAGGIKFTGDIALDGDVDINASHATNWSGIQLSANLFAGGDIQLSGASTNQYGVLIDAFKTVKTSSNTTQSVTITGDTASSTSGIALIGQILTQNGSTLLATGTATNGGKGIYTEITTGGTNYGKIGSATSGDITLIGTSSGGSAASDLNSNAALNQGHGLLLRGDITTQGKISLTGTADNGVGVFLQHSTYDYGRTMAEVQPTLQVLSGGANMAGQDAIHIDGTNLGSNPFGNNGVLIGSRLLNQSNGGATTITSAEGGVALVTSTTGSSTGSGSITNASTAGAISISAGDGTGTSTAAIGNLPSGINIGNNVSRAWTLSTAGTLITQNSNAGVTITSDGTGNVTPSKIINNGTGNVSVGAGIQLAAGTATGGNVLTASGNTITQNSTGKTYIYSGAASGTGALANLSSSFASLFYAGNTGTINTAFNKAYNSTIAGGPSYQVLFRQAKAPAFSLNLSNLSKTYGESDPTNLNATFLASYTSAGGPTNLTQTIAGTGGNNVFSAKAADIFNDLSITRSAGTDVGTYAYSMTGGSLIDGITGSTSLVINKRDITLSSVTASNKTYDGSNTASITGGTFNNLVAGETLLLTGTGSFSDANVGNGKTVTASVGLLSTADGSGKWSNYNLTTTSATGSANITPAALTLTVNSSSAFVTQDPDTAFNQGFSYSGFVNGETASTALVSAPTRRYIGASNPSVGTYANAYDVVSAPQATNGNYTITVQKGSLNVIAADALMLTVASQSSVYGNLTSANDASPAQGTVTAQYCLVQANCNGTNLVSLTLRKDPNVANQWLVNDSTNSQIQFSTSLNSASYSGGGYLNVGNYDYALSPTSPTVIGTQNFNTVLANTGSLAVTPLAVTLNTNAVSKTYDGTTTLPATTLSLTNTAAGDDLQVSYSTGSYASSAKSSTAAFSLYGLSLSGTDVANYTLANYIDNIYTGTGAITGSGGSNPQQPIIVPPKPIIPSDGGNGGGGDSSGGDASAGNPYVVLPNNGQTTDRCNANNLEACLCEEQPNAPIDNLSICYQPKKTAETKNTKNKI
jgi:filamentous hemagglutinin family protein